MGAVPAPRRASYTRPVNLIEPDAASTLIVSQNIDLVIPIAVHSQVRDALPSNDPERLEINFIGRDPDLHENTDSYVLEDPTLPLMVFGLLGFLREGEAIDAGGVRVPLPKPAGLLVERLLTERSGLKGERDLLVALGLLMHCEESDVVEVADLFRQLPGNARAALLANLAVLSLMRPLPAMPDPVRGRGLVEALLARLREIASEMLRNGGFEPHPIGMRLEPAKSFFVLSEEMVPPGVGSEVPLQEARRILLAPAAILIPFRRNTRLL